MKKFTCILTAALSVLISACSDDLAGVPVPDPVQENAYVNLRISIETNNSYATGSAQTRADGDGGETTTPADSFECGIPPYEEINSMRVIMLDESYTVEYNEFIKGLDGTSTRKVDNINLRTKPGGKRHLYLIANEASLKGHIDSNINSTIFPFSSIAPGRQLSSDDFNDFKNLQITAEAAGMPLFSDGTTYVPMTEFFDIEINEIPDDWPENWEPYTQLVSLFVTRTVVKFSFIIQDNIIQDNIIQDKIPFTLGKDYIVSKIKINSTGEAEYLFPNNVEYSPAKKLDDPTKKNIGREIVDFNSVANTSLNTADFTIEPNDYDKGFSTVEKNRYGILKTGDRIFTYAPPAYYPETKLTGDCTMDVTVTWCDNGEPTEEKEEFEGLPLKNLPQGGLPRNTHVLVIISAGDHKLEADVRLVPYIGVELNPEFGFEDLRPGKKEGEEDPETPEVPENQ